MKENNVHAAEEIKGSLDPRFVSLVNLTDRKMLEIMINQELLNTSVVTDTERSEHVIIDIGVADGNNKRVLYEIYRILENTFRLIGGGTGDIIKDDEYNKGDESTKKSKFRCLVTIHPDIENKNKNIIISFYRYAPRKICQNEEGNVDTPMTYFWTFSKEFMDANKNNVLELGTAGTHMALQDTPNQALLKSAHHNSRTGLARATLDSKSKIFVGKMTAPDDEHYPAACRDLIITYLDKFKRKSMPSATPKDGVEYVPNANIKLPEGLTGNYRKDRPILKKELIELSGNENIGLPGMVSEYLKKCPQLEYIGTIKNGNVYELGIVVEMEHVDEKTKNEHFGVVGKRQKEHPDNGGRISFGKYLESRHKKVKSQ